jgi:hypothetical protein
MRKPQKYEIHTTEDDVVEIVSVETEERAEMPRRAGRQIHCPRPDFDLLVNGVRQQPCDPSVVPDKSWHDDPEPSERVLSMRRAAVSFANDYGPLPAANSGDAAAAHEVAARLVSILRREGLKIVRDT